MTSPFDVAVIVDRLKVAVPQLRSVGRAADYAAVRTLQDFPAPCAFVILAAERGLSRPIGRAPRGEQISARQTVEVSFGVVVAVRNWRQQQGEQIADELRTIVGATRAALMGYVPDVDGARPCEFVRGDLQDYSTGTAIWADVYATQHAIGNR
jgi:hypothetical protein